MRKQFLELALQVRKGLVSEEELPSLVSQLLTEKQAILILPNSQVIFELDNISVNQYRMSSGAVDLGTGVKQKFPIGELITVVTSNAPQELKKEINYLAQGYLDNL